MKQFRIGKVVQVQESKLLPVLVVSRDEYARYGDDYARHSFIKHGIMAGRRRGGRGELVGTFVVPTVACPMGLRWRGREGRWES